MITRADLKDLFSHREYPSVSILLPTNRSSYSKNQDTIKLNNLARKATDRLEGELSKREAAGVVKRLQAAVKKMDWSARLDGMALFVSKDHTKVLNLPFKVKPRVMVDETFATRDVVYAYNRAKPFRVLVLGHTTRLFDAWNTILDEHRTKPFPMKHRGMGGGSKLPGGIGVNTSGARDEAHRTFYKSVDDAVAAIQKDSPLPLVLVGAERTLAFYQEVTRHASSIVGMLAGNHEKTTSAALGKLVLPVFEAGATVRRTDALVKLDQAVGMNRSASGMHQVWKAAVAGNVQMILVEKNFTYPADIGPEADRLTAFTGKGAAALDDAVDEVIERVMSTGGEVFFYPPGDLGVHQKIAAVLRH